MSDIPPQPVMPVEPVRPKRQREDDTCQLSYAKRQRVEVQDVEMFDA
jgi:hypothetical protein